MSNHIGLVGNSLNQLVAAADLENTDLKVYRMRWFILCLFVLSTASSTMQWIQYSIIADVIVKYYNTSYTAVDWTAMIFLTFYVVFIYPGMYLLDKFGIRIAFIIGIMGTCLGAWIKVFSVSPDRFWVLILGQGIVGISQVFILSVPPQLAAVWFGPNEVSSACSVGIFGIQLGTAIGFLLPPMLVTDQRGVEGIEHGLYSMSIGVAVVNSVLLFLLFVFFKNEPPTPPSPAQTKAKLNKDDFLQSLKQLICNRSYVLLWLQFAINIGIFYAISTLLNQISLKHYPDAAKDAGIIGLVIIIFGMTGTLSCGIVLDRLNRYRATILIGQGLCVLSMVTFALTLSKGIVAVYVVSALLGFFMTGLLPVAYELAAELTYPIPESTSGGLLTALAQGFGIVFTYLYSFLFTSLGDMWANLIISVLLLLALVLLIFIKFDLRRQAAQDEQEKN